MSERIINLDQRQGYPMGSLFKAISERQIQVEYRDSVDPELGDQVKMWTDAQNMGRAFKIVAFQILGTTKEEGIKKYRVIAETILPVGASATHKP